MLKISNYNNLRSSMSPGDVIAFGGKGTFSEIIKWATRAPVSHVGVILQSKLYYDDRSQPGFFNQIIESTSLNGQSGVTITRLSDRIDSYDGEIWLLPLRSDLKQKMDKKKYYDFLIHQDRKPYDMPQAIKSALDLIDDAVSPGVFTHNLEDFSRFFCSELVAAALENAGVIDHLNASEVTPVDLCSFNIYEDYYYQMKGHKTVGASEIKRVEIKGVNSLNPNGWGE